MITIKTRLSNGSFYETSSHGEWATCPKNLLKTIKNLSEIKKKMFMWYGQSGPRNSWIEIQGVPVEWDDLHELNQKDAKKLIDWVTCGSYRADKAAQHAAEDAAMDAALEAAGYNAGFHR